MKKFMALSLAAMTALALAGCGSGTSATTAAATEAATEAKDTTAADTTAADTAAADTTAAEKTASDKTYIINTDTTFAPFEFENEKGDLVGIDMDILKAVAEDQGFSYEVGSGWLLRSHHGSGGRRVRRRDCRNVYHRPAQGKIRFLRSLL